MPALMPTLDALFHPRTVRSTWPALVVVLALVGCADLHIGCAPSETRFMHRQHRETYAINEQDLERLQFSVSSKVIAHDLDAPGAEGVVLVPAGTPGLAIASGPRWIRVRFQKGGQGVVFLADPAARGDTGYALATESDGADGYRLVRDVPDHVLRVGGRRYRIIEGDYTELLVDDDMLRKLIAERRRVEGERIPEH